MRRGTGAKPPGLNSRRRTGRALDRSGRKGEIHYISVPPGYLRLHKVAVLAGILYARTMERVFPPRRGKIIVKAKRAQGQRRLDRGVRDCTWDGELAHGGPTAPEIVQIVGPPANVPGHVTALKAGRLPC